MNHVIVPVLVVLVGCAPAPVHPGSASAPPALAGPAARLVELTAPGDADQPRAVQIVVDEPALKLATIALRNGTALPPHHADVPVTIMALEGAGTVVAGAERLRIDRTHAVVLAAAVPHAVEPDPGTDLVLLVHHLGRSQEHL